ARAGGLPHGHLHQRHRLPWTGLENRPVLQGAKHAGENLAELLKRRPPGLAPLIQMCDALSWNTSHLPEGVQRLLAHCMSHGRRQFVEVAENFPEECRYVLETLGGIWHHDALARKQKLSPRKRLRFHQEHSGPLM